MSNTNLVNDHEDSLTDFLSKYANSVFNKRFTQNNKNNIKSKWIDRNCILAKDNLKQAKINFNEVTSDENRHTYIKAKNKYNNAKKKEPGENL